MLDWAADQKEHPVMIIMPGNAVTSRVADTDFDKINTFKAEQTGEKVAILALGDFYQRGQELEAEIEKKLGFKPTLVNPRFASGLDEKLLNDLAGNHQLVVTLEDGVLNGGFGQSVAAFYATIPVKVKSYGLRKEFYDRYDPQELLHEQGMTTGQIIADIEKLI